MTIYTIETHGRPVVVVSVGDMPALEDSLARERMRKQAMDEALDTWLGEDLRRLESDGRPLWDGDRDALHVREASPEEVVVFKASREQAIREGELEAGDEDWVTFLVPVTDPDDDEDEEDE
jgi:hypothetical protein